VVVEKKRLAVKEGQDVVKESYGRSVSGKM